MLPWPSMYNNPTHENYNPNQDQEDESSQLHEDYLTPPQNESNQNVKDVTISNMNGQRSNSKIRIKQLGILKSKSLLQKENESTRSSQEMSSHKSLKPVKSKISHRKSRKTKLNEKLEKKCMADMEWAHFSCSLCKDTYADYISLKLHFEGEKHKNNVNSTVSEPIENNPENIWCSNMWHENNKSSEQVMKSETYDYDSPLVIDFQNDEQDNPLNDEFVSQKNQFNMDSDFSSNLEDFRRLPPCYMIRTNSNISAISYYEKQESLPFFYSGYKCEQVSSIDSSDMELLTPEYDRGTPTLTELSPIRKYETSTLTEEFGSCERLPSSYTEYESSGFMSDISPIFTSPPIWSDCKTEVKTAINSEIYKCFKCDRTFTRKCYLTQHNRTIHCPTARPYKCDICGKFFKEHINLEQHHSKHTGDKPFKCDECPKQFNHKNDLYRHKHIHRGKMPFPCDACGRNFIRRDHMLKHRFNRACIKNMDKENITVRSTKRTLDSNWCDLYLSTEKILECK